MDPKKTLPYLYPYGTLERLEEEQRYNAELAKKHAQQRLEAELVRPMKQAQNREALKEILEREGEPKDFRQMLDILAKLPHRDIQLDSHVSGGRDSYYAQTIEEIESEKRDREARARTEEQQRWTVSQELRQKNLLQQRYSGLQQSLGFAKTFELRAKPNPFVPPFQNGL